MAVSFLNSFLSYLVVLVVIAAVGAVAITLGITLRKKKNKKRECNRQRSPLTENKGYGKIVRTEIKAFISDKNAAGEHGRESSNEYSGYYKIPGESGNPCGTEEHLQ